MSPKISDLAFAAGAARLASSSTGRPNSDGASVCKLGSTSPPPCRPSQVLLRPPQAAGGGSETACRGSPSPPSGAVFARLVSILGSVDSSHTLHGVG